MANKYCNLDGAKKIKDEYPKINTGFENVEVDINAVADEVTQHKLDYIDLNNRVDTIITTPTTEISVQEIVDARQGELSLGANLTGIKAELLENKNQIQNNNKILNFNGTKFLAHRGLMHFAPENTIPSITMAGELGFWASETDILNTVDGNFVCIHDLTIDRTTNGTGTVTEMTLAQIKAVNIDTGANMEARLIANFATLYPSLKVPTLEEWVAVCKEYKIIPVLEVKLGTTELRTAFYNKLKELSITNECILLAMDEGVFREFRALDKNIVLGVNNNPTTTNIELALSLGNCFINCSSLTLTEQQVKDCHNAGLKIGTWVVNSSPDITKFKSWGVDIITTDYLIS